MFWENSPVILNSSVLINFTIFLEKHCFEYRLNSADLLVESVCGAIDGTG